MLGLGLGLHKQNSYRDKIPTLGIMAKYKFNNGSGQILTDYSGNNNNAQLGSSSSSDTNDPTWDSQGLVFGGDDYALIPNTALVSGNNDLTMIVAAKVTDISVQRCLMSYGTKVSGSLPYIAQSNANTVILNTYNAAVSINYTPGENPYMVTFRYTASNLTLDGIINNDIVNKVSYVYSAPLNFVASNGAFGVRKVDGVYHHAGNIFYGLIYNRALSDAEIVRVYKNIKSDLATRGVLLP